MKHLYTFLGLIVICQSSLFSQNPVQPSNTADRIIESGNLIIEILKVINSNDSDKSKTSASKESDCESKNFTNICFVNRSSQIIVVTLELKSNKEKHELIVVNNGKECCYRVSPGVYIYSIEQKASVGSSRELIRKGEILLEKCKDLEVKIK